MFEMKIKDLCIKAWSILSHPKWWFNGKNQIMLSKVNCRGSNKLRGKKSFINKSDILVVGSRVEIELEGCELFNCNIFVRGEGHHLVIEDGVRLHNVSIRIIGWNNLVHIGSASTVGSGQIVCGGKGISIHIGKECMFADGVDIWSTDTHSVLQEGVLVNEPESITIGDHVWLGKDVAVLKGVTIGDNAVIGMRSLVTKDIRPGTLNVGSPAKEIREGIEWTRVNPNN